MITTTQFPINLLKKACLYAVLLLLLLKSGNLLAQTKGLIYDPASGAGSLLLDPNQDGFVSSDNGGFLSDDETESEIAYIALPTGAGESDGDVSHGADCSYIDLVNTSNTAPLYFYSDGTYLFFRVRIGGSSNSSKTYSVFIDSDEKYGFDGANPDPNALTGNPGFEVELSLHTNGGVAIYDVDGNIDPSANEIDAPYKTNRPANIHSQRSIALTEVCDDLDYFYDFYVSFDDLSGAGIDANTSMRMVAQSGISANPIIGTTSGTDLGGVDDDSGNVFDLIEDLVDVFPPISGNELAGGDPVHPRADCPGIDSPIQIDDTEVSGTSTEADGASIEVLEDGVSIGNTFVAGGTWSITGLDAFTGGEVITAIAFINGEKSESEDNCNPVTVDQTCSDIPTIEGRVNGGSSGRGLYGTSDEEGAIVTMWTDATLTLEWTGDNATYTNPGEVGEGGATGTIGEWQISGANNALGDGVFYVTVENSPDECESEAALYCNGVAGSDTPIISTDPILTSTTTITGTSGGNAEVELFIDGVSSGSTDTAEPGGAWSITVSDLEFGTSITVKATDTGLCPTESSASGVTQYSIAPLIYDSFCYDGTTITEVSGISSENSGTTVTLYTKSSAGVTTADSEAGTGTVDANGNWTVSGLALVGGTYMAATNTATNELESNLSNEVEILSQTTDGSLTLSNLIINEGDASLSGNGTNGNTIQLYIDDLLIDGFSTTVSSGTWTIDGLDETTAGFDVLYPGGQVGITSTESGKCGSSQVYALDVVQCKTYLVSSLALTSSASVCVNETISLSFSGSESLVFYQLYTDATGTSPTGLEVIGDGNEVELTTDPLSTDITKIYLLARRIGVDCNQIFSTSFNVTVKDIPAITLSSNSIALCDSQTSAAIDYIDVTNGPLLTYSIDFDATAEAIGITDLSDVAIASQLTFNVPADAPEGSYTGNLAVSNSNSASCVSSDYAFSFHIIENNISYGDSSSPTTCLTDDGAIAFNGLTPNVFYTLSFELDDNPQSETNVEADKNGSYNLTRLAAGVYQNFLVEASGCVSNKLKNPITLSAPSPAVLTLVKASSPSNCLGYNGFIELGGMEPNANYTLDYLNDENPVSEEIISDDGGQYNLENLPNGSYDLLKVVRLGCESNELEAVIFSCPETLYNTPVVTPNGDGFNDFMEIEGIENYPNNEVVIFNRWGNLIWEKSGYKNDETGFGGVGNSSLSSAALTDGTYFIVIDLGDGSPNQKKFVVIKR